MPEPKYLKQLKDNRVTDGLLREFLFKGLYPAARQEVARGIREREEQIDFLKQLDRALVEEIGESDEE